MLDKKHVLASSNDAVRQIRHHNTAVVREALHSEQVATSSRLKELTGLSAVTVNKILSELQQSGEIYIGEAVSGRNGGRPAASYCFNANFKLILLVVCYQRGGRNYAGYSVHDLFGECLERREELLSGAAQIDELRSGIDNYFSRFSRIALIGLSMPSDSAGGRVGTVLRHDPFSRHLGSHLASRFSVPVFFETDINAATLGYCRKHNEEYVSGVVLARGRAPACGFCYQGTVLRGKDGLAGEIRYFPMYDSVGVLPEDGDDADKLALRTLRAVMCVLNPQVIVVYTETLRHGLQDRLRASLMTEAEKAMMPRLEVSANFRDDIVSGMISLCLDRMELSASA